jgi:hypothetical protein
MDNVLVRQRREQLYELVVGGSVLLALAALVAGLVAGG